MSNAYEDEAAMAAAAAQGRHRHVIGGLWEELGTLQLEFLRAQGLEPRHVLIDVGCGSLRAGVKLVPYLDPGTYFGIDRSPSLLDAGYSNEIVAKGLASRLPFENLRAVADFDLSWTGRSFDCGIAQSVFTHLPLDRFVACLTAIRPHFRPEARFFATFFEVPTEVAEFQHPGGVKSRSDRDPFHFTRKQILAAAATVPGWKATWIGDWRHPRDQQIAAFTRTA